MFLFLTWTLGILEMNIKLISSKYPKFISLYFWMLTPYPRPSNLDLVSSFKFHSSHPSVLFLLCIFYYYAYHPLLFDKVTSPLPCEEEHGSNFRNSQSKACLSNLSRNGEVFLQQIDFFSLSTENFKCYWSLLWNSGCVLNLLSMLIYSLNIYWVTTK